MKGQFFMEFVLGISIMILVFTVSIGLINYFTIDSTFLYSTEKDDFMQVFYTQIYLLEQSDNDAIIVFKFPKSIGGDYYNLMLESGGNQSVMTFNFTKGFRQIEIPFIENLTLVNNTGKYFLIKRNDTLYIDR